MNNSNHNPYSEVTQPESDFTLIRGIALFQEMIANILHMIVNVHSGPNTSAAKESNITSANDFVFLRKPRVTHKIYGPG